MIIISANNFITLLTRSWHVLLSFHGNVSNSACKLNESSQVVQNLVVNESSYIAKKNCKNYEMPKNTAESVVSFCTVVSVRCVNGRQWKVQDSS